MTSRRPFVPRLSIDTARENALAALTRGDAAEFARLSLDLAGLLDRVADVDAVRAELQAQASARVA